MSISLINPFFYKPQKILTFLNSANQSTGGSSYTFSSSSFGTASSTRRIIVSIAGANNSRTISSVTIGGVSADIVLQYSASGDNNTVGIAIALVPTGTSGSIVVNWSGTQDTTIIGWWAATGLESNTAYATSTNTIPSSPATMDINGLENGFYIGVAGTSSSTGTNTWGNATERYDIAIDRASTGADAVTTSGLNSYTLTTSYTGNSNRCWIGATW